MVKVRCGRTHQWSWYQGGYYQKSCYQKSEWSKCCWQIRLRNAVTFIGFKADIEPRALRLLVHIFQKSVTETMRKAWYRSRYRHFEEINLNYAHNPKLLCRTSILLDDDKDHNHMYAEFSKKGIRKFYERWCSTIARNAVEPGETEKQWKRSIRTAVQENKKNIWTEA